MNLKGDVRECDIWQRAQQRRAIFTGHSACLTGIMIKDRLERVRGQSGRGSEKPRIYALMLDRAASQRQSKLNLNLNELGDEGFMTQMEDNG